MLRIKEEAGEISDRGRDQLFLKEYYLRQNRERAEKLASFPNHLGTAYCTSGISSSDGWILDWGLVKLATGRFQSFTPTDESGGDQYFLHAEVAGNHPSRYQDAKRGGMVAPDEVKGSINRTVFKCGRTTGRTKGELNAIDSSIRMGCEFDDGYQIVEGKALVVVSPPESSKLWPDGHGLPIAFAWKGDSGSLVFDYQGRVLGIYFGGQHQFCDYQVHPPIKAPSIDGIHFISPIHPTLDAIRATAANDTAFRDQDIQVDFVWGSV